MPKNNKSYAKKNSNKKNNTKKAKPVTNPATRPWGKIIIAILALLMCCGSLISLIYLIVQNALH